MELAGAVHGLVTRFGSQIVHDGLDLEVRKGEVLAIVGGSGTGKSVLLRTMLGLIRPGEGRVELLGEDLAALSARRHADLLSRIGMLFQDGALFGSLTVAENVAVPMLERLRLPARLRRELIALKLALVGLPTETATKYPSQLSGGMRKRAGLARALSLDPELVFLDEPTAGLDPISASAFDELIMTLQRGLGLTVVMVTHDLDTLAACADRVAALVDGAVIVGTLDEVRANDHPWLRAYFGGPRGRAAMPAKPLPAY